MILKGFKKIYWFFLMVVFVVPVSVRAAIVPCGTDENPGACDVPKFFELLVNITNFILGMSGSLALFFFVYGGFMMLISGGSQDRINKGKQIITNSVIGLVLIFCSFLIVDFTLKALGYTGVGTWFNPPSI